jgi:hypothetical protein
VSVGGESAAPIEFMYEYRRNGWAHASISDGNTPYDMRGHPMCLPTRYSSSCVRAVVEVLRYGGDAWCSWYDEPATQQWTLHRAGDLLQITIRSVGNDLFHDWPANGGKGEFAVLGDLWKFAAKVRLAVSRMVPVAEQEHTYGPAAVQRTAEYRALCAFLDERTQSQRR